MRAWLALLAAAVPVAAQDSMAEAARRERERRKAASGTARRYTDADLSAVGGSRAAAPTPEPSPRVPAEAASAAEPDRRVEEARWRARFAEARARLKEAEARAFETVVEPVLAPNGVYVPMRVMKPVETEELRRAREALSELEEELRRSGGPPGWARE